MSSDLQARTYKWILNPQNTKNQNISRLTQHICTLSIFYYRVVASTVLEQNSEKINAQST